MRRFARTITARGADTAKTVVIDDIHITARLPNDLAETQAEEIRTTLAGDDFMDRLRWAVRAAIRAFPEMAVARVSLTR